MLAIIPARAGSKGLPGKNLALLGDRPLVAHTIAAARGAARIDRVVVSTDSRAIADAATAAGAEVPFLRAASLSTDTASTADVCLDTCRRLAADGENIDAFTLLQPTSPLRSPADIDGAIALFEARSADAVIAVVENEHPVEWTRLVGEHGQLLPHPAFADLAARPRQDHPRTVRPNGAVYVVRTALLQLHGRFELDRTFAYEMPRHRSIDIDTADDLLIAEALLARGND